MTKIQCKKGVCKLVPATKAQVGRGLYSTPTYYLVPLPSSYGKQRKKRQTGSGKTSSTKKDAKKKSPKSKKSKATKSKKNGSF